MKQPTSIAPIAHIENRIYIVRGQRVMLDQDLASLYETSTSRLNEQLSRNLNRFPEDFAFRLTNEEWKSLISQFATSNKGRGGRRKLPMVFTEHGALMLANVLRSERAAQMSIQVTRAFIRMRQLFNAHEKMGKTIEELKSFVLKYSNQTDREFRKVWNVIETLAEPSTSTEPMGFKLDSQ